MSTIETATHINYSKLRLVMYFITTIVVTGILIRVLVLDSFTVVGNSMAPTIADGDYVFVNKLAYTFETPQRGDVVVGDFRNLDGVKTVKRIVGLPQEWVFIENGKIYIASEREGSRQKVHTLDIESYAGEVSEDMAYRLDPHEYFLIGDNGLTSTDSRELGPVDEYAIDGRVFTSFRLVELTFRSIY